MNHNEKLEFPRTIKELRKEKRLTQLEVGQAIGLAATSYGNAEACNFRKMSLEKVHALARFHNLDEAARDRLVAAWEALPESDWHKANRPKWERRNKLRARAKELDACKLLLVELTTLLITSVEKPDALCNCSFDSDVTCELCKALGFLGLKGWTTREDVIEKLAAAQEKLEKSSNTGKSA